MSPQGHCLSDSEFDPSGSKNVIALAAGVSDGLGCGDTHLFHRLVLRLH